MQSTVSCVTIPRFKPRHYAMLEFQVKKYPSNVLLKMLAPPQTCRYSVSSHYLDWNTSLADHSDRSWAQHCESKIYLSGENSRKNKQNIKSHSALLWPWSRETTVVACMWVHDIYLWVGGQSGEWSQGNVVDTMGLLSVSVGPFRNRVRTVRTWSRDLSTISATFRNSAALASVGGHLF